MRRAIKAMLKPQPIDENVSTTAALLAPTLAAPTHMVNVAEPPQPGQAVRTAHDGTFLGCAPAKHTWRLLPDAFMETPLNLGQCDTVPQGHHWPVCPLPQQGMFSEAGTRP